MQGGGECGKGGSEGGVINHHAVVCMLLMHGHQMYAVIVSQAGKTAADMATDNNGERTFAPEYFRRGDFKLPFDWKEYCHTTSSAVLSPIGGMMELGYTSMRLCPGQEIITPQWARIGLSIVSSQDAAAIQ